MIADPRLIPILASAGIVLGANGVMHTLVAVRAHAEGFPETAIGLMGTGYFVGFIVACLTTARMIQRSGHIRVFAAMAAVAAAACLALVLFVDAWVWVAWRFLMGVCFAGIATVLESWLNALAGTSDRGRVLALYRIVDLAMVTGTQFLVPAFGAETFHIFVVTGMMFCLALVPVCLSRLVSPPPPESARLRLGAVFALSPVACVGVATIGLTNGAFRIVGPVYAQEMGLTVDQVAIFMSLGIAAGAVLQYPIGWISDRFDRRSVLIVTTAGAALASLLMSQVDGLMVYVGVALFGGFAIPLYSISTAHANDHAGANQFVEIAAGLILFYSLGAAVGPTVASALIEGFGPQSFFVYTSVLHGALIVVVIYRMSRRAAVPRALRRRFVALLRTSPQINRLSRRDE